MGPHSQWCRHGVDRRNTLKTLTYEDESVSSYIELLTALNSSLFAIHSRRPDLAGGRHFRAVARLHLEYRHGPIIWGRQDGPGGVVAGAHLIYRRPGARSCQHGRPVSPRAS